MENEDLCAHRQECPSDAVTRRRADCGIGITETGERLRQPAEVVEQRSRLIDSARQNAAGRRTRWARDGALKDGPCHRVGRWRRRSAGLEPQYPRALDEVDANCPTSH